LAPATTNNDLGTLRSVLTDAVKHSTLDAYSLKVLTERALYYGLDWLTARGLNLSAYYQAFTPAQEIVQ